MAIAGSPPTELSPGSHGAPGEDPSAAMANTVRECAPTDPEPRV